MYFNRLLEIWVKICGKCTLRLFDIAKRATKVAKKSGAAKQMHLKLLQ